MSNPPSDSDQPPNSVNLPSAASAATTHGLPSSRQSQNVVDSDGPPQTVITPDSAAMPRSAGFPGSEPALVGGSLRPGRRSREGLLARIYRAVFGSWVGRALFGRFVSPERLRAGYARPVISFGPTNPLATTGRVWFHAASVGELESLWPVIRLWAAAGGQLIVSVFSESTLGAVRRLETELRSNALGSQILFIGYSPLEGAWRKRVEAFRPDAFVTVKYECWPDLWAALAEGGIPLVTVGAKPRPALRLAAAASLLLQGKKPDLVFICSEKEDARALGAGFRAAKIRIGGDPRWDRVRARMAEGSTRARALVSALSALPRPWGVLGSAWLSDLQLGIFSRVRGTLWVVPHRIDPAAVAEISRSLEASGLSPLRSSESSVPPSHALSSSDLSKDADPKTVVLVDEMGFLLELYAAADWAYIGGGFEAGVHSTIEPAIRGIPICAGPKRAERFPEIDELRRSGQLTLIHDAPELVAWLKARNLIPRSSDLGGAADAHSVANPDAVSAPSIAPTASATPTASTASVTSTASAEERARWLQDCEGRFGAADGVIRVIHEALRESRQGPGGA